MARKLDDVIAALPKERQERVEARAMELATLKDLRHAAQQTQAQLASALGVGQDTISRLEKRHAAVDTAALRGECGWPIGAGRPISQQASDGHRASGR